MKYIIGIILFFIGLFLYIRWFQGWAESKVLKADRCGHVEQVIAWKVGSTLNGKNDKGEDVSCYVRYELNGKLSAKNSEYWNIGNCNDTNPLQIAVADYSCH